MASPSLHTLFECCADIHLTRGFYTDVVGLTETFFDADKGWLTYLAGPVQIVFTVPDEPPAALPDWSRSPAWDGGTVDHASWVLRVSAPELAGVLERAGLARTEMQQRTSEDGRLNEVFLRDPLGRTVEVYFEREEGDTA